MSYIDQYKLYRQTQVHLHTKILEAYVHETEFKQAAGLIGILNNRNQVVIETEADHDALCDFNIYGNIRDGKNLLSRFADNHLSEDPLEKELLAAMLQSESSLYEITEVDQKEGVLVLHDVLHSSNQPVKLVDRGLSGSVQGSALVYTRLIHLEKFTMTSGLGFMFSMNHKDYILNRSRKMLKKTKHGDRSVDTFIVFFHLNRSDGLPVLFENVTT